jgi:hypothetical protein
VFETRDFYLACFLRCSGYALINLRDDGKRKVFVFRERPTRRDDAMAFYGERAVVPLLALSSTIKDMKGKPAGQTRRNSVAGTARHDAIRTTCSRSEMQEIPMK